MEQYRIVVVQADPQRARFRDVREVDHRFGTKIGYADPEYLAAGWVECVSGLQPTGLRLSRKSAAG